MLPITGAVRRDSFLNTPENRSPPFSQRPLVFFFKRSLYFIFLYIIVSKYSRKSIVLSCFSYDCNFYKFLSHCLTAHRPEAMQHLSFSLHRQPFSRVILRLSCG